MIRGHCPLPVSLSGLPFQSFVTDQQFQTN
uniref:Uncharacterized protein n=1 Tax=Anguilla anguilla TaxID=7936 RepID=A0A0E9XM68_ANGAN